jgi:aspartate kinase
MVLPGMTGPLVVRLGGSCFPSAASYAALAVRLAERIAKEGAPAALVVSAMPDETARMRQLLHEVAAEQAGADPADADLATAEADAASMLCLADTISAHLLAGALRRRGRSAVVLAGHQLGLTADPADPAAGPSAPWARLVSIDPRPLELAMARHDAVIVPGCQAVDDHARPAWLGQGSGDLSAVAVAAAAVGADRCEILSDADGIHSSDPNLVPEAWLIPRISYDAAAIMARYGAKILHLRTIALAGRRKVTLVYRRDIPPFAAGTTIGATGNRMGAVIVGHASIVLRYDDDTQADLAYMEFHARGIETVRLAGAPCLRLSVATPPCGDSGAIMTCRSAGRSGFHVARDTAETAALARRLHYTMMARYDQQDV